ncbi:KTSC domain-containing protein [Flavobacterium frigidarium]|uniref:KTSC domain-containing protein n=1 Tax=Flavobacterium frigidarium TaxID=99286 RepID=UPI00042604A2|nr:KTSC domain-containing protein [Flavobacterium frigidarium]|tara:strand:+ start:1391 stop:1612 length:222 start_codon:yes stop_codon:yes gene_type:complete
MSLPEMFAVSSSNIQSIGYDEANQDVYVQFINGSIYVYKGVPIHEYENLRDAPSLGSYLHRNYKNVYAYERIG